MKGLLKEFKEFISRGNVVDLALAVIVGGAFTGIVTAFTESIVNPLILLLTGGGVDSISVLQIAVGPDTVLDFGALIGAIINFLIIALAVFLVIKAMNKANDAAKNLKKEEEKAPEKIAPKCPFCKTEVPEGATRCPHCTSQFDSPAEATEA